MGKGTGACTSTPETTESTPAAPVVAQPKAAAPKPASQQQAIVASTPQQNKMVRLLMVIYDAQVASAGDVAHH